MAESTLTKSLKRSIWFATKKMGVFGCFEVTIGFNGKERVDYMTLDTKGTWRCYEIKISKSDFHSKAKNTFVGHYNYYVMTPELYEIVKDEIPKHIGAFIGSEKSNVYCKKNAKKQLLGANEDVLKMSMIRSMNRDVEKNIKSGDKNIISKYEAQIERLRQDSIKENQAYHKLSFENYELKRQLRELKNE
jgi:hypothetical protein